jgi:ABC-type transporter Mla subunit MlaD
MDLDVMGKHIHSLLAFKGELEKMMEGSGGNVEKATDQLDQLMQFKSTVEAALPDIGKMVQDISTVVDDIAKVKTDLAPVLEWIAAQQKAAEDLKAAHAAEAAAAASEQHHADTPPHNEPPPGSEAAAERSESEHSAG